jgi:arylsulfatase A-like enzyme
MLELYLGIWILSGRGQGLELGAVYHKEGAVSYSVRAGFIVAFILSLTLGFIEMISIILFNPPSGSFFPLMLSQLAATVGVFLMIYLVTWFLVLSPIGKLLRCKRLFLSVSFALFLFLLFALILVHKLYHLPLSSGEKSTLIVLAVVCILVSWGAYILLKREADYFRKHKKRVMAACIASPLLLAETLIFSWLYCYRIHFEQSMPSFLLSVFFVIAVTATILLFSSQYKKVWATWLPIIYTAVVLFCPSLALLANQDPSSFLVEHGGGTPPHRIKRVIFILDDTLRPDYVSCYGSPHNCTPSIDQLANDGIRFSRAISAAPWTLPSISSIFTGLSPMVHKTISTNSRLPDTTHTLAEYLRDDGYYTMGIGSNPFLSPQYNTLQGFIDHEFFPKSWLVESLGMKLFRKIVSSQLNPEFISTTDITNLSIDWLKSHQRSDFFLYIHYYDPHHPYAPPTDYLPSKTPPASMGYSFSELLRVRGGYLELSLSEREWVRDLYRAECRFVDMNVGRIISTLKQMDLYDSTLIIFASDHGEELWDHEGFEHGHTLYDELLWVPLIVKLPMSDIALQVDTEVSTQSILPTVLTLCEIDFDPEILSSTSLSPLWSPSELPFIPQPIFSTSVAYYEDRESILDNGTKYIRSLLTGKEELYDMVIDPHEQNSILTMNPQKALQAKYLLEQYYVKCQELRNYYEIEDTEELILDHETKRHLRSLGYFQ